MNSGQCIVLAQDGPSAYVRYIWTQKYIQALIQSVRCLCSLLTKIDMSSQFLEKKKIPNIAFRGNAFRGYRVV